MKRLIMVAVVLAISLPALASATNYTNSFAAGDYKGTVTSVIPQLNGKTADLKVTQVGDKVIGTVTFEGGKEVWTWDDTSLNQKEIDAKSEKVVMTYDANAAKTPKGNAQSFNIKCKDKANNVCDAGADHRNYWTLKGTNEKITYTVYGVDPANKSDKSLKAAKRHQFVFTKK
ncbi:MAG: hypothetical protein HN337_01955 [Deltaproteobacteria bacterium]|jgi:opacity protein-like surface antigen|nr:hypothetical protein [Deltaproteobacteria bacterium]